MEILSLSLVYLVLILFYLDEGGQHDNANFLKHIASCFIVGTWRCFTLFLRLRHDLWPNIDILNHCE